MHRSDPFHRGVIARRLAAFLLFLLPAAAHAQSLRRTNDENSTWLAYTGVHPISKNWRLQLEAQLRQTEGMSQPQQRLFRTALLRVLSPAVRVGGGYAVTRTYPPDEFVVDAQRFTEHRTYQQLDLRLQTGAVLWDHRYRLEQRWGERLSTTTTNFGERLGWTYTNRARYFLRTIVAPGGGAPEKGEGYFVAYDEVFINFGDQVRNNVFDQNRVFVGAGYRFRPTFGMEAGYLSQIILRGNGTDVERNHTLLIALFSEFPIRR